MAYIICHDAGKWTASNSASGVKEDIRTSHIPVILLTAKDSIQDKEEGYESGADSYLTKPFSAKLLNSRVHNLLESAKKLALIVAKPHQKS